jgi:hypothetical protein
LKISSPNNCGTLPAMDRIDHSMDEIKHRLISLEGGVLAFRRDVLSIQENMPQDRQKARG